MGQISHYKASEGPLAKGRDRAQRASDEQDKRNEAIDAARRRKEKPKQGSDGSRATLWELASSKMRNR